MNAKRTALIGLCLSAVVSSLAQGTAFTYQGQLNDGTGPASGTYDLSFTVFDAVSGGTIVAGPLTNAATAVSNGLFTAALDFGAGVFTGPDRWLAIGVQTNGGSAFDTVAPRQPLTPAPYSIYSGNSAHADQARGVLDGVISVAQLNTAGAPASGQVLAYNGSQLAWQDPVIGGSTGGWSLNGNQGTTPGLHYLGTSDNQPLELKVGGVRGLRLEPTASSYPNVIGGGPSNLASNGVTGAVIGGGINNVAGGQQTLVGGGYQNRAAGYISTVAGGAYNQAYGSEATVGGGAYNMATNEQAFVGGGYQNKASGIQSLVGGGFQNTARGYISTVAGGAYNIASGSEASVVGGAYNLAAGDFSFLGNGEFNSATGVGSVVCGGGGQSFLLAPNLASGSYSFVGGGTGNTASGDQGTVPGGSFNTAKGMNSFAAGTFAQAVNDGCFVWADAGFGTFSSGSANQFLIRAGGGMGIGTSQTPPGGLRVDSGGLAVTGASSPNYPGAKGVFIEKINYPAGGSYGVVYAYNYADASPHAMSLCLNSPGGFVGIGTTIPQYTLDVNGTTRTHSIIITGGADLAEPFQVGKGETPKGSVVVIDEEHPGELKPSTSAYDTRVAGIVSGANGINPGIALYQEGALAGGQNVALTGRVYVLAEATHAPIKPGDLLTTSDIRGHAMKVTDHARAQGAILGKAMGSLNEGKGMVLVLVTLQ